MARILIVDDDDELCMLMKAFFTKEGFEVITISNPEKDIKLLSKYNPSVILLDILMPEEDGLSICQRIRSQSHAPIILISAKGSESDKVLGLGLGADDYIQKPFSMNEIVARVKALIRRSSYVAAAPTEDQGGLIEKGKFTVDTKSYTVWYQGTELSLTMKEYKLLLFFIMNENQVFERETLYERIWGYDSTGDSRTVMVHIRKLRKKIESDPNNPTHILTVWGIGYKFIG